MSEITKSFNELLLEKLNSELSAIKKNVSGYFIDINSFYPYFVDPQDDNIQASEYPVSYVIISDENLLDLISSKTPINNYIDCEIGIMVKITRKESEVEKENIKKSLKYYLRKGNKFNELRGFDASYLNKTPEKIKCYTHEKDSNILLITFNFQIKTNLIY